MWNFQDATYLEQRGVTFAVWSEGPSEQYAPFREFVRVYYVVVYGLGSCDRERYERLQ